MNEKTMERYLTDEVRRLGGLAVKLNSLSMTGLPDRMLLMPGGRVYFAEMKSPGQKPSTRQQIVIGILKKLGFVVEVIDNENLLFQFLRMIEQ